MNCTSPYTLPAKLGANGLYTGGLPVPCGHCMHCRVQRTAQWTMRLQHEYSTSECGTFLTLTYDDEHLPYVLLDDGQVVPTILKSEIQNFMKRLRKRTKGTTIKYFACGEYGDQFGRPHYHLILFNYHPDNFSFDLSDVWNKGQFSVGSVTYDSCRYVAGYVQKKWYGDPSGFLHYPAENLFSLKSQGLGKNYVLQNKEQLLYNAGTTVQGVPVGLPRYYKQILTDDDPTQLAELNKRIIDRKKPVDIQKLLSRATPVEQLQLLTLQHPLDNSLNLYIQAELRAGRRQSNETLLSKLKLYQKGSL